MCEHLGKLRCALYVRGIHIFGICRGRRLDDPRMNEECCGKALCSINVKNVRCRGGNLPPAVSAHPHGTPRELSLTVRNSWCICLPQRGKGDHGVVDEVLVRIFAESIWRLRQDVFQKQNAYSSSVFCSAKSTFSHRRRRICHQANANIYFPRNFLRSSTPTHNRVFAVESLALFYLEVSLVLSFQRKNRTKTKKHLANAKCFRIT